MLSMMLAAVLSQAPAGVSLPPLRATAPTPYAAAYAEVKSGATAFAYVGVGAKYHALVKALAAGDSSRNAVPVCIKPCKEFPREGVWLLCKSGDGVAAIPQEVGGGTAAAAPQARPAGPVGALASSGVPPAVPPVVPGGADPIAWRPSLAAGKAEAAKSGKPVLLLVSGEACPPCRRLEADTLAAAPVIEALNNDFTPVKLIAEQAAVEVAALKIDRWPTAAVFDPKTGNEVRRIAGYCGPDDFLAAIRGEPQPRHGRRPAQNFARAMGRLFLVER